MTNKNLQQAQKNKNDEFYTQLVDIEKELKHCKDYFKGKQFYATTQELAIFFTIFPIILNFWD